MIADGYTKNKIQLKQKDEILKSYSITACLFKIYPTFYNNEYIKARKKYDEKRKSKKFTSIEKRGYLKLIILFVDAKVEIPK